MKDTRLSDDQSSLTQEAPKDDPVPLPGVGKELKSHRHLALNAEEIRLALNARPELGALLFINPALVLEDLGYKLSPEVRSHILRNLSLPKQTRDKMQALEREIRQALGEDAADLNLVNPSHTAQILFCHLRIHPLETSGVEPPYKPVVPSTRLKDLKPPTIKRVLRPQPPTRHGGGMTASLVNYQPQVKLLDPDGLLPILPRAEQAPSQVCTEELIFYREAHPLVPKLLCYQLLYDSQLAFRSGAIYREVRDGQRTSVWKSWIKSVNFAQGRGA